MKGLADDNIRRDTIRGLGAASRSLQRVCDIALEAEQTRRELSELLDDDLHSREFQLYKDLVHRNMDHDKIEALLLSCKTDTLLPKWGHEPSPLTRPSSVPLPKQSTYNPPVQGPGYGSSSFENKRLPHRPALSSKNLPDRSTSKNQYINGKSVWGPGHGALCVKCGETGHVMKDHIGPNSYGPVLPAWEQSYLRNTVFGDMSAQLYFCTAGYGPMTDKLPHTGPQRYHQPPKVQLMVAVLGF